MKNYQLIQIAGCLLVTMLISFSVLVAQSEPWEAPASAKSMKNPTGNDKESLMIGKSLYDKHCRSCHGKSGLGDGPKAAELDTPSGDFTLPEFQAQTDGELFWKTTEGRDDMPTFEKKIPSDEDRWLIVNYMRSFAEE
jgi:mono/diheme cytochrome c family protein